MNNYYRALELAKEGEITPTTITLSLAGGNWAELDGKTYQAHFNGGNMLRLTPVEIRKKNKQCPVILGGERCGGRAGHDGKHFWARGD